MDTEAYLRKQGWRGSGHSLDSSNKGLKKPLLVSKKIDVLGIGINKHDVVADQWWMKALDSSLKDFGTGKKSLLGQVKEHGIKRGGLYGRFVQGEGVPGTMGKELLKSDVSTVVVAAADGGLATVVVGDAKKKRKAEDGEERAKGKKQKTDEQNDKSARRAAKKAAKEVGQTDGETSTSESKTAKKSKAPKRKEETLETLSEDKRQQYSERAAAKGVSLKQYFAQRQAKNLQASSEQDHPWAGRKTADLSEEERKERRKWLRERRSESGHASGETSGVATPVSKEKTEISNGEDSKTTSANASSAEDETKSARKTAKRLLKEQKKEAKEKKSKKGL